MSTYLFQLGNTPELSLAELETVYPQLNFVRLITAVVSAELQSDTQAEEILNRVGGTIKIIKVLAEKPNAAAEDLSDTIVELLSTESKVQFAISELGRDHLPVIDAAEIKSLLQAQGIKARYREDSRYGLSAAILLNNKKIRELYVVQTPDITLVAETIAVQNIDDWTNRDRNKPYADAKKGMLPPKVARMMVNLAVGASNEGVLLDPFCGSGTVLMEAMMLGFAVIGNDQDSAAVTGTQANLAWLSNEYNLNQNFTVLAQDATRLNLPQKQKVDYLVTEPFLGKPNPNPAKLPFIFTGLERLYLGAFRQWVSLLKDEASLAVVFPYVEANFKGEKRVFSLESLIDKLQKLGYTTTSQSIMYRRPGAVVQRQIYQFKFNQQ